MQPQRHSIAVAVCTQVKNMSNKKQTLHDFDLNIIYDFFSDTERQGPGSPRETLKALGFIPGISAKWKIADLGCGTGGQTMVLAENTPCTITGVDTWPGFIERFNQNAHSRNLHHRVKGIVGDMHSLPFAEEEFDLIWSEGAIYNIGFERGLNEWRKFLKPGGTIAVTENTWFCEERPAEIQDFWQKVYPEIDTIPNKIARMQKAGFLPLAAFVLPESVWLGYYDWQRLRRETFLLKYKGRPSVEEFVANMEYEAALYYKYKQYYGYVFYIGKKV